MGQIEEPEGIDFVIGPSILTSEAKIAISNAIAHYYKTGETPKRVINEDDEGFSEEELESLKEAYKEALLIRDGKLKAIPLSDLWKD